jgi:tRNA A-37 threonylcarbamoyl transferase component Bud32
VTSPGSMLGRYRLDAQVGQGGMAVVFRAFDTQLRRTVAVKVLHPHLHAREETRRRFDREAHAVARLHHPHILDVYDFSGPDAQPSYLVTEFIPGQSLRAFAEAHPFDPPELAACCAVPLAAALGHAHAAGVVHRDVKPENVMVRQDGAIKLTDFGIAALLDPDEKFTVTGSILGSPAHLAPETIDGRPADPRSDLFSLGTLLYWLACGKLPFHAPTPAALLRQILEGTPQDPRLLRPSVSDGLARLILALLERDPDKRQQSAAEVEKGLVALLAEAGIDDPVAELRAFVQGQPPEAEAARLRAKLVERALQQGEEALRDQRTSAALAAYGRVLSLEPGHAGAKARLAKVKARARRVRLWRRAGAGALLGLAAAAGTLALRSRSSGSALQTAVPAAQKGPAAAAGDATTSLPDGREPGAANVPATLTAAAPTAAALEGLDGGAPAEEKKGPRGVKLALEDKALRPGREGRPVRADGPPPGTVIRALLMTKLPAHVTVDEQDLGYGPSIEAALTVGQHLVTVTHECCADRSFTLDVTAEGRYPLQLGEARAAKLLVVGAPPEAPVKIDGREMGLVSALGDVALPMTSPDRKIALAVGDRSGQVTIKAGKTTPVDYLKQLEPGAP